MDTPKRFTYVVRNEAFVFRRLVNKTLFQKRLQGDIVERFTEAYYDGALFGETRADTHWLGVRADKCPLDLWIYQELIQELRRDLIVETGTASAGVRSTSRRYATWPARVRSSRSTSSSSKDGPLIPACTYLTASSILPETALELKQRIEPGATTLFFLDSDHKRDHVLQELRLYAPLVSPGSYIVVEDTILNGHPVSPEYGPGPMEAVEAFLAETDEFEPDERREKFYLTFNRKGYLRRKPS